MNLAFSDLLKRLAESVRLWAKAGFPVVDDTTLRQRADTCFGCPKMNRDARFGLGRCDACGCSLPKLELQTERCPIGKW